MEGALARGCAGAELHHHPGRDRVRKGHGARNMAVVRHFALNIVRSAKDKRSLKRRRKRAGFDPAYLESLLNATR
jgi:hypothetical protein